MASCFEIARMLSRTCLAALLSAVFAAAGCHTLPVPPMATTSPHPLLPVDKLEGEHAEKTFVLGSDWSHGPWVLKRGAKISFRPDGTGHFSAVVYAREDIGVDELHFQSIQYGADGNVLFAFPDNPVGYPLHIRRPLKDFPYDADFGFDPRHYHSISEAKFFARLRIHGGGAAAEAGAPE